MTARMGKAVFFSMGIHALFFLPFGFSQGQFQADVVRGISSVELELLPISSLDSPRDPAPQPVREPKPLPAEQIPEEIVRPAAESFVDDGAKSLAPPLAVQNPPPRYPWTARLRGWEGTVVVRALVSKQGRPVSIHIQHSSGYSTLDQAALVSIREWIFRPARKKGKATAAAVEIPVTFRLHENE